MPVHISDIPIVRKEIFIRNYKQAVKPRYQTDIRSLLNDVTIALIEGIYAYHHLYITSEQTNDGVTKKFAFNIFETTDRMHVFYVGMTDE